MQTDAIETIIGTTPPKAKNPGKLVIRKEPYRLWRVVFKFDDGKEKELKVFTTSFEDAREFAVRALAIIEGAKVAKNGNVYYKGHDTGGEGEWIHRVPGKGGR